MKMSDYFYVKRHPNLLGQYEIHAGRCGRLPVIINRNALGLFDSPQLAKTEAKRRGYKQLIICPCHYCMTP